MKIKQFIETWQNLVPVNFYKASTRANYDSHIRKYILPDLGELEIGNVNTLDVQAYVKKLLDRDLSAKTVRNIVMTMRVLWKSALAWQLVKYSPFFGLMLPKVTAKERIVFTLKQISDIIAQAPPPSNLFFWLAAETGMRAGELCGLRREDVSSENCLVHVRQAVWSGRVQLPKSKNAIRTCSISPQLTEALRVYFMQSTDVSGMRFVFRTRLGYPWNPSEIVKHKLHPVLRQLEIPLSGLHAFRHTAASLADQWGLPLKERQQRLGHADARLTLDVYTHAKQHSKSEQDFVAWIGKQVKGEVQ